MPLASILPWNLVLRLIGSSEFTDIARYFVTDDWKRTLIFLRMKESEREFTRTATIDQLKGINGWIDGVMSTARHEKQQSDACQSQQVPGATSRIHIEVSFILNNFQIKEITF